jgi:hypothetical protein
VTSAPDPARVVADADVLAVDVLVGGDSRQALDRIRSHSWIDLVASDALLADAESVIARLADDALAADWRTRMERERLHVEHPAGDHPGLASAYRGEAAHLLTLDEAITGADTGLALQDHVSVSVRDPTAFLAVFDPERLYPTAVGGEYPGPDRDPRA